MRVKIKVQADKLEIPTTSAKNKAMRIGAFTVLAEQKKRLFGQSASGFGNYKSLEYLNFRQKKYNRINKNINFVLSGEMSSQYVVGSVGDSVGLGFTMQAKTNDNPNASGKAEIMGNKFKGLFDLTESEQQLFYNVFEYEFDKMFK